MASLLLDEIEEMIGKLSPQERSLLMRRLASDQRTWSQSMFENQLKAMADDPEVQSELRAIEREFAATEADGLRDA